MHPDRPTTDETSHPSREWLVALRSASSDLQVLLDDLDEQDLTRPSLAGEWTVAQVLSHLGSGAEICAELVRRGLAGDDRGPQRDQLVPVWERWDALSPADQAAQWRQADAAHLDLLAGITADQEASLRVPYFAGPMDLTTYLGYRLSEHALHGWDVAATYDASATVGQVDLVWRRIDMIAARFHDSTVRDRLAPLAVALEHDGHPDGRRDRLDVGAEVHVVSDDATTAAGCATATTDVLVRLVYGRLRPEDQLELTGPATRDDLVRLFPGF